MIGGKTLSFLKLWRVISRFSEFVFSILKEPNDSPFRCPAEPKHGLGVKKC